MASDPTPLPRLAHDLLDQDDFQLCAEHNNPRWWRWDPKTGHRRKPCRNPRCRSVWCRWGIAQREYVCLARNFDARSQRYPDERWFFGVLKSEFQGADDLWNTWRRFCRRLNYQLKRRARPPVLYYARIEFDEDGAPHIHALTTATLRQKVLRHLWTLSCGHCRDHAIYWKPIYSSPHQAAAYILKTRCRDKPDRIPSRVPNSWRTTHLTSSTRNFWLSPRSSYWTQQLDEWYPDRKLHTPQLPAQTRRSRPA